MMHLELTATRFRPLLGVLLPFVLVASVTCSAASDPDEIARIVDVLDLQPGMQLADLGAGEGEWAQGLLPTLGDAGSLWATEVEDDKVEDLRRLFTDDSRVRVVLGDDQHTGLPTACCNAVLMRLVYHHFTDPAAMRADLKQVLQPGGRLLVIDIEPQEDWRELDGVPDRGGHGIPMAALVDEMTTDGFRVVERFADWSGDADRYAVLFEAAAEVGADD